MSLKRTLLMILCAGCFSMSTVAQENPFQVYTSYIYHFTKYTEWPAEMKKGDFVIGILGQSDIKKYLEGLASQKKVGTQSIVIKVFPGATAIDKCHILFIPKNQHKYIGKVLEKSKVNHSMLLTEVDDGTKDGSVINFFNSNGKIKFELSMNNAEEHSLKVSTFLQRLATVVD